MSDAGSFGARESISVAYPEARGIFKLQIMACSFGYWHQAGELLGAVEMQDQEAEEHETPGQEPDQTKDTVSQLLSR